MAKAYPRPELGNVRYVDEQTLAAILGVSCAFIRVDRLKERRFPYTKIGACVRYPLDRVLAIVEANMVGGGAK